MVSYGLILSDTCLSTRRTILFHANGLSSFRATATGAILLLAGGVSAQTMVASDDGFGIPYGQTLLVEAGGVLDNDLVDGEPATDFGATAQLVTDAAHGNLVLSPDGSFSYTPGPSFTGQDSLVYLAVQGTTSDQGTVFLSACTGGPDVFMCWREEAFQALATDLGYFSTHEGFEGGVWENSRTPVASSSVDALGIRWTSNYPDAPIANRLSTTQGPPHTGLWALFDPDHGYAEGSPGACDVDFPAETCRHHDGFTGTVIGGGQPLVGVGGYIEGTYGANMAILVNDTTVYAGGKIFPYQFFGIVDTRPAAARPGASRCRLKRRCDWPSMTPVAAWSGN